MISPWALEGVKKPIVRVIPSPSLVILIPSLVILIPQSREKNL